ncbi:DsrE family protein [Massilia sp. CFBP9012]|uniref:DsrE family protein n=1 Tax=Massilia sp. CFBP9012 TaxID=3096531 RepID=UPI002A6B1825|nr:DsrE family protein [Massilia sp. CFBP9012]MDY0975648.1 DsrE family protein [Massilia sp. CFBP9012]
MNTAARGLAILVWSCDLSRPELLATPFMTAQAAAALDMRVKMLFSSQSVLWLLAENATRLTGFGAEQWPISRHLEASADLGVEIRACTQALHASGADRPALAPHCAGVEGMVSFVEQGSAPGWRMLVF